MHPFSFTTTAQILCESGASLKLAELCHERGARRVLIVTDPGITRLGLLDPLLPGFARAGMDVRVFDQVLADPPEAVVLAAVAQAREQQAELVIGFGGGSSMDVAKLVALLGHPDCEQALAQIYGVGNARGRRLPLIQIPTTAGTGSEVTPIAIVTTGETTKMGVVSPLLLPDLALLDADLTLGLPPTVTAATGIDAMVHAIEAYTSALKKNPISDLLAREALRLLAGNLDEVVGNGGNRQARQAMLLGACLAGQAFANAPVAAVHALAYPLGGRFNIAHGVSNALLLPYVMAWNKLACVERMAEIATALGVQTHGLSEKAAADLAVEAMAELCASVDIPKGMRSFGVPEDAIPAMAEEASRIDRLMRNNPRRLTAGDIEQIYRAAY